MISLCDLVSFIDFEQLCKRLSQFRGRQKQTVFRPLIDLGVLSREWSQPGNVAQAAGRECSLVGDRKGQ